MLEKERDGKRVVRILAAGRKNGEVINGLGRRVGSVVMDDDRRKQ